LSTEIHHKKRQRKSPLKTGPQKSYPQMGLFRFFGSIFSLHFCVFGVKIHNWPQKNWVCFPSSVQFSTIGFNGFVWVWIGFFSIFCVPFRSTFGFRMALSKFILGFIGFRLGFFHHFLASNDLETHTNDHNNEFRLKDLHFLKAGRIYFSKNHGGRKIALYNHQPLAYPCRKIVIFLWRKRCKSLWEKGLKNYGIFRNSRIVPLDLCRSGEKNSRTQEHKKSRIQGCKDTGIQEKTRRIFRQEKQDFLLPCRPPSLKLWQDKKFKIQNQILFLMPINSFHVVL
jgi:hypothetical protein